MDNLQQAKDLLAGAALEDLNTQQAVAQIAIAYALIALVETLRDINDSTAMIANVMDEPIKITGSLQR